ncbi:LysR family transcriptional regulator [Pseudorhodoplanes sp.]|uniref:LysR family transcriptional regulator n=1 Tax=Pseudorhodoplanes sp. TaxID=1934341 RepID=UPI003D11D1A4
MRIHARALTGFDMIRRCGSIREASRRLNISSSALNRQLLQLEAELGMPLFERLPQGLRLTPVGEILARHVMALLQDVQRLEGELAALKGLRTGTLDVASVAALTPSFLPNVLQRMTELYPAVSVNVRIADSVECARLVASGDADLALAFLRQKNPAIRQYAVGAFPLGAVMPATHPLSGRSQVTFAECARFPLVMPNRELSIYADVVALAGRQKHVTVVLETGSLDLMKGLALRGLGIGFLNRFGIEKEVGEGALRHVPLRPAISNQLGAYVRAERALPPALDAFARVAADEIALLERQEIAV